MIVGIYDHERGHLPIPLQVRSLSRLPLGVRARGTNRFASPGIFERLVCSWEKLDRVAVSAVQRAEKANERCPRR